MKHLAICLMLLCLSACSAGQFTGGFFPLYSPHELCAQEWPDNLPMQRLCIQEESELQFDTIQSFLD